MPSANNQPIIEARALGKTYPNGCRALDAVSLAFAGDDFVVILGRSGAGKSTLIRLINRLLTPSDGRLFFRGADITHASGARLRRVRGDIGMIFQQFNLVSRLTVLENVLCGRLRFATGPVRSLMQLCRLFTSADRDIAFECLQQVGIEQLALQRADRLSGGQQQRVAIARTLAQEPQVVLADEPIASLDPRSSQIVMDILARVHDERGIPVIVNLHQLEFARDYGRRIIGMADGRLVYDGTGRDLNDESLVQIYGCEPSADEGSIPVPAALAPSIPRPSPTHSQPLAVGLA